MQLSLPNVPDAQRAAVYTEPRKLARADNPATSKDAAVTVAKFATVHHAVIVVAMQEHAGERGLTVHEIAAFCRLDAHSIGKRCKELEDGNVIETRPGPDGEPLTRPSPSGRAARVWFLAGQS